MSIPRPDVLTSRSNTSRNIGTEVVLGDMGKTDNGPVNNNLGVVQKDLEGKSIAAIPCKTNKTTTKFVGKFGSDRTGHFGGLDLVSFVSPHLGIAFDVNNIPEHEDQ